MKIIKDLLKPNPYNFPGLTYTPSRIVIHYTGDKGATADQLSKFYNNTASGMFKNSKNPINTSCNYIIGWDGKIIQKALDNQMTYSVTNHNIGTIAIEVCYNTDNGKFSDAAIKSLTELVPSLMSKYNIGESNVLRHYDLTGKHCPIYYVDNKKWVELKNKIINKKEEKLYRVQIGAFRSRENAENYLKEAENKGFSGFIIEVSENE